MTFLQDGITARRKGLCFEDMLSKSINLNDKIGPVQPQRVTVSSISRLILLSRRHVANCQTSCQTAVTSRQTSAVDVTMTTHDDNLKY